MGSTDNEPWRLTATEALKRIQANDMTVEQYAQSLLSRISDRDDAVKAWAYLNPDQILARARELDRIPLSQRGPLHGLPIGIKDVILTKDMPTQFNSKIYASKDASTIDAAPVITLRAAGALIFGKTSTTEFATSKQGNWHQNLTSNARDPKRTPGGSSSGSGAAVADFQVPIALGTQTGGSIVRPASFNGCYGWKPTWGAVSREGLAQWSVTNDTCGFFARSVEDLRLLADIFRVDDDERVGDAGGFQVSGARVGFCESPNWAKAGPGTKAAMEKARELIGKHGGEAIDVELPEDFGGVLGWHADILSGEGRTSFLGQYLLDKAQLHEDIHAHVENKRQISRRAQLDAYDNCARLRPVFDDIAKPFDVIITPSAVDEAPLGLENTGDMSFCSTWTVLHVPAINVPGFVGKDGMPVGLTLVGPRYTDRHLLHVAEAIGRLFESEGSEQQKQ